MAREEIWKFQLGTGDEQDISMPRGAEILTAQIQGGIACLWARVQPEAQQVKRRIVIAGTGWPLHDGLGRYIATIQQEQFVWHIFESDSSSNDASDK